MSTENIFTNGFDVCKTSKLLIFISFNSKAGMNIPHGLPQSLVGKWEGEGYSAI